MNFNTEYSMENPLSIFNINWQRAKEANDANAGVCSLATVSDNGEVSIRTLVLREVNNEYFVVFINESSPKWTQLNGAGHYELHVFWPTLMQQFRARGECQQISMEKMEEHWNMKPYDSKILDHYYTTVKAQSSEISSREELLAGINALKKKYPTADDIPFSPIAKGVNLKASSVEHWRGSPEDRIHHRHLYLLEGTSWQKKILVP